jgi:hypothetical protein
MSRTYSVDMVRAVEAGRRGLPHETGTVDSAPLSAHSMEVKRYGLPHEMHGMHWA